MNNTDVDKLSHDIKEICIEDLENEIYHPREKVGSSALSDSGIGHGGIDEVLSLADSLY
jgi:hypothetical protein